MADKDDSIQKLQVDNYYVWSRRAKAELIERNCWNAIDPGFGDAVDEMNADQQRVNRKAYAFLLKHVADSYVEDIGDTEIAKAAWEILERIHSSFTLVQTVRLLKEMMNQEKTEAQTMHEYMAQIQALNRKIAKGGWNLEFTDRQLAGLFLVGLPEKYDVAVEFLGKEEALSTELVKTRLLREESERRPNNVALTTSKASRQRRRRSQNSVLGAVPVAETKTRRGTLANRDVQVQAQVQDAQQPRRATRIRVAVEAVTTVSSPCTLQDYVTV